MLASSQTHQTQLEDHLFDTRTGKMLLQFHVASDGETRTCLRFHDLVYHNCLVMCYPGDGNDDEEVKALAKLTYPKALRPVVLAPGLPEALNVSLTAYAC